MKKSFIDLCKSPFLITCFVSEMIISLNIDEDKEPETELDYDPTVTKGQHPTKKTPPIKAVKKPKPKAKKPKNNGKV